MDIFQCSLILQNVVPTLERLNELNGNNTSSEKILKRHIAFSHFRFPYGTALRTEYNRYGFSLVPSR